MTTSPSKAASLDIFAQMTAAPENLPAMAPGLVDLSEFGCINVTGEESVTFLQGQFTNHIPDLTEGECHITGYCNPKGRALAVLWLLRKKDGCYLLVPRDLVEGLVKRLQMYRMRAKVEIAIESGSIIFGMIHPVESIGDKSAAMQEWSIDQNRRFVSVPGENVQDFIDSTPLTLFDTDYWRIAQILAGEPMVYAATYEALIPQHMNLDLVRGVSFTKGCYPGQEIVARLRYLGKLKQRMIIGKCEGREALSPGTPVFAQEKPEQKAGVIIDAVNVGDFNYLSVNVPASHISKGEIHIGEPDGAKLERLEMPYGITLEKESS